MSGETLPEYLDLLRLAEQGAALVGHLPLRAMKRLVSSLVSDEGEVEAELRFEFDPIRRPQVSGWVRGEVELVCQRCLETFRRPLTAEFRLVLVQSEAEGERLMDGIEPLLRGEEQIRAAELLEDELILALPVVAMHGEDSGCQLQVAAQPVTDGSAEQRKPGAFAALATLNRKND